MRDVAYWPKTFLDEVEQSKVEQSVAVSEPGILYSGVEQWFRRVTTNAQCL